MRSDHGIQRTDWCARALENGTNVTVMSCGVGSKGQHLKLGGERCECNSISVSLCAFLYAELQFGERDGGKSDGSGRAVDKTLKNSKVALADKRYTDIRIQ